MLRISKFAIQRGIAVGNDTGHCDTIDSLTDVGSGVSGEASWRTISLWEL
ncbi:hypothetical protein [Novipirellula sp.]